MAETHILAQFKAAPPVLNDGMFVVPITDSTGHLIVGAFVIPAPPLASTVTSFRTQDSVGVLAHAGPATLLSVSGTNDNASTRYLQVFNQAAGPPAGAPLLEWPIFSGSQTNVGNDLLNDLPFPLGIVVGVSTTSGNYVAATAADHNIQGVFQT